MLDLDVLGFSWRCSWSFLLVPLYLSFCICHLPKRYMMSVHVWTSSAFVFILIMSVTSLSFVTYRSAHQRHRRTQSELNKKTSTPSTSDRSTKTKTINLNLVQGKTVDVLWTSTSYFDVVWNAFANQKDGSIQWIPEHIVGIGEDFHSQVDDDKAKTTLYKVCWSGSNSQDHVRSHRREGDYFYSLIIKW